MRLHTRADVTAFSSTPVQLQIFVFVFDFSFFLWFESKIVFLVLGYTPEDSLGTYYIYHLVELVGLIASGVLVYCMHTVGEYQRDKQRDVVPLWPLLAVSFVASLITRSNANDSFIPDFLWMYFDYL